MIYESISWILIHTYTFECISILNFLQNIGVVNMILDWICYWIMSSHILIFKYRFSLSFLLILLNLHNNIFSECNFICFLSLLFLFILHPLIVFKLIKCFILLILLLLIFNFYKLFILYLIV